MTASHTTVGIPPSRRTLQVRYVMGATLVIFVLFWPYAVTPLSAQTYLQNLGVPPFTTALPVESGFINAATGNLHIEIPLGSFPERGGATDKVVLMYDSAFWTPYYSWYTGFVWEPINVYTGGPPGAAGWRLVTSGDQGATTYGEYDFGYCSPDDDYAEATYSPWIWIAPDGTQHSFPASTTQALYPEDCPVTGVPSSTAYASDGSGFYISISDYTDATVYAPDGTAIGPLTSISGGSQQIKADPNGNQYTTTLTYSPFEYKYSDTLTQNVSGTLTRPVVDVTASSDLSTYYYAVPNDQGGTNTFTLKTQSRSVHTAFDYTGWSEYSGSLPEVTEVDLPDGTKYQFNYDTGTGSGNYGLMTQMTLPTGGTIYYGYTNFTDAAANVSRWITQRTTPDSSTPWTYSGPDVLSSCTSTYDVNCQQRIKAAKPSGDYAQYTFTLNGGAWPTLEQYYDSSSTTLATISACYNFVAVSSGTCSYSLSTGGPATNIYRTAITTTLPVPSGSLSKTTEYTWDPTNIGNVTQIAEWNFGSSLSSAADRTTSISYYSGGQVINHPATTTVTNSGGGLVSKTVNTYDGASLLTSGATGITQHDDADYGSGFTARGNLTQVQRYMSSAAYLTSSMTYDITGQMRTFTDGSGNETTYGYSDSFYTDGGDGSTPSAYTPSAATNAFLTSITQAYGSSIAETGTFGYYWGTGQPALSVDPNMNKTYSHFYDSLNRPTSIRFPDMGWTLRSYTGATEIDEGTGITSTTEGTSCSTTGNSCRHDESLLDGLGRMSSQILVSDPNGSDTVGTTYDQNGRVYTVSNPQRSSSSPSDGTKTLYYDGLDRVTKIRQQDGSYAYTYYGVNVGTGGGTTTSGCASAYGPGYPILRVDESGNKRQSWIDGFGRLIEVDEPDSSGGLTQNTCYVYDLNNNLTNVVAYGGTQQRSFTYDLLSRVTSATTPESGTTATNYYYAASGGGLCSGDPSSICRQTDPRSITTTYSYDALNRLTSKTYSDGTTPSVYYDYDQSAPWGFSLSNYTGRMTTMYTVSGGSNITASCFSYDTMGRPLVDLQFVAGNYNEVTYTYNYNGDVASLGYPSPSSLTVTPAYNSADWLSQVTSSWSDSQHPGTLAIVNSYWPVGEIEKASLGNGLTMSNVPNPRTQACRIELNSSGTSLTSCSASTPSGNLQDFQFGYGASNNGNLLTWSGTGAQAFSRSYTYDALNRLTAMSSASDPSGCTGLSWSYDAWGNRTQTVTSGTGGCGNWSPSYNYTLDNNRITSVGSTAYTYDGAGNLTYDGSHTYVYDAENRLTTVDSSAASYVYDAEGRRVQKAADGVTTQYVYDESGNVLMEMNGSVISNTYVYLGGQLLAEYTDGTSGTTQFVHQDHLGSTRFLTNVSGCITDNLDYLPFGELNAYTSLCTPTDTTHKFTSKERDSESNLDNFIARDYSFGQGRFMSPDPLGGDIGNPQSLNRYAYVLNNPLTLTDPSGMQPGDGGDDDCGDVPCGIDFSFLWASPPPPPPPVYNPPNPSGQPNPPAGDPDPNGPFSGPIWQEGGPQIQATGNLAALFGLQMPSPFIINNFTVDQGGNVIGSYNGEMLCTMVSAAGCGGWMSWNGGSWIPDVPLSAEQAQTLGMAGTLADANLKSAVANMAIGDVLGMGGAVVGDAARGPWESALFGRNGGFLNSNPWLRVGYGWFEEQGSNVFRVTGRLLNGGHYLNWPWP